MTLRAVALLAFSFGLVRALFITLDEVARRRQRDFSTIFRDLATLFVYGIVFLMVARFEFNVDVTPLLATSALVTAVVGLALQETLGNVFSGLSLQLQKPFAPATGCASDPISAACKESVGALRDWSPARSSASKCRTGRWRGRSSPTTGATR